MKSLQGRVAVVTGAARGIGRGIAEVLAGEGGCVVLTDRDNAVIRTAQELREAGSDAVGIVGDVVEGAAMKELVDRVVDRHGRIDILAANAGIYPLKSVADMQDSDWDTVMDVNVKGVLHSMQACIVPMRAQRYGRIVLTSSLTGPTVGAPMMSHYAASKAAVLGLMRSAALELVTDAITVNAVLPGSVRTPGTEAFGEEMLDRVVKSIPMGRHANPADIGWAVRFLASDEAEYITGQTIVVDGGQVIPEGGWDGPISERRDRS